MKLYFLLFLVCLLIMATCSPLFIKYRPIGENRLYNENSEFHRNSGIDISVVPKSIHYQGGDIALETYIRIQNNSLTDFSISPDSIVAVSKCFDYINSGNRYDPNYPHGYISILPDSIYSFKTIFYNTTFKKSFKKFQSKLSGDTLFIQIPIKEVTHNIEMKFVPIMN